MNYSFLRNYSDYRENRDRSSGEQFAGHMHRLLSVWSENGNPEPNFVEQFQDFTEDLQGVPPDQNDLLDLGIMHALEAVNLFKEERPAEALRVAKDARYPFLAYLDENSYRSLTSVEFHEIDFQIYERIQGNFPHESARKYLLSGERTDLWSAIRYLEGLESREESVEILSVMIEKKSVLPEKLILLAFWFLLDPGVLEGENRPIFQDSGLVEALSGIMLPETATEGLDAAWPGRLNPAYENEALFFLQALFEISGSPLTPGWIALFERSVSNHWRVTVPDFPEEVHEPNPEFAGSILHLLEDEQLDTLVRTSLIAPLFMEHIEKYVDFSFYEISSGLARMEELFSEELGHTISRLPAEISESLKLRLDDCAELIGSELILVDGALTLKKKPPAGI